MLTSLIAAATFSLATQTFDPNAIPARYQGHVVPTNGRPPTGFQTKVVALTFDDGPHASRTTPILNVLEEEGVPATMFLVGQNVARYRNLMQREKDYGLELANHTYTHPRSPSSSIAKAEVERTISAISAVKKPFSRLFRPPYGERYSTTSNYAMSLGYASVLWTSDSHDWELDSPNTMLNTYVIPQMTPGDIILMHDNRPVTDETIRLVIQAYRNDGYQFVTVTQMLWLWDAYLNSPEAALLEAAATTRESAQSRDINCCAD